MAERAAEWVAKVLRSVEDSFGHPKGQWYFSKMVGRIALRPTIFLFFIFIAGYQFRQGFGKGIK